MKRSAGSTLRRARLLAGLTQAELGRRAGVDQSVISAYESRRREPSVENLRKLVRAAGFDVTLSLSRSPRSRLQARVDTHREELVTALAALGASNVRVFGSVARGADSDTSDVDLLVEINDSTGLFGLGRMRSAAEEILGVPVDVIPENSIKPDLAEQILAEAVPL